MRLIMIVVAVAATLAAPQVAALSAARHLAQSVPAAPAAVDRQDPVQPRRADFGSQSASAQARQYADWIATSSDNGDLDFVIVDKRLARVYVFDASARLRGSSPVLLGAARGDESVPGIGIRPIAQVLPHERTTPAGRFVGERGSNANGEDVVWVDYDAAVSMHRVRATNPKERRLQRLASPSPEDNRISYGCINVPTAFYDTTIGPLFAARDAIIYVLPESPPVRALTRLTRWQ